jgi:hypothetical protein
MNTVCGKKSCTPMVSKFHREFGGWIYDLFMYLFDSLIYEKCTVTNKCFSTFNTHVNDVLDLWVYTEEFCVVCIAYKIPEYLANIVLI